MNLGLSHFGATPRSAVRASADVAATAAGLSITGEAARDFQVTSVRPVAPVENAAEAREQARQQVMAERGVDMLSMFRMSAQDRIQAEAQIMVETSRRTRPSLVKAAGGILDLRI
jgi:hypothetical protein